MELSQEPPEAPRALRDEIAECLLALSPSPRGDADPDGCGRQADAVMALLHERGHYLPGAPPAAQILKDAEQFAGQLILATLTVRIMAMLATITVENPETKPTRKWLNDYLDGRRHGPVGKPMLWPSQLPGLASMLRQWGFQPTTTNPAFVARGAPPNALTQMQ